MAALVPPYTTFTLGINNGAISIIVLAATFPIDFSFPSESKTSNLLKILPSVVKISVGLTTCLPYISLSPKVSK